MKTIKEACVGAPEQGRATEPTEERKGGIRCWEEREAWESELPVLD